MTKTEMVELGIEHLEKLAIDYFIEWYSFKKKKLSDFKKSTQKKMIQIIKQGFKDNKIGELLAAAYLIDKNYDIGWSNIHLATIGNAEERGVDLLVEKGNKYFFVEIKTNTTNNENSIYNLIYKTMKQLEKRLLNTEENLAFMDNIKWFEDDENYESIHEFILKNIDGLAFVVAPDFHESLNKNWKYDLLYGRMERGENEKVEVQLKGCLDE